MLKFILLAVIAVEVLATDFILDWPQTSERLRACPYGCEHGEGDSAFTVFQMCKAFGTCIETLNFNKEVELKVFQPGNSRYSDWAGKVAVFQWSVMDNAVYDEDFELKDEEKTAYRHGYAFDDSLSYFQPLDTLTKAKSHDTECGEISYTEMNSKIGF